MRDPLDVARVRGLFPGLADGYAHLEGSAAGTLLPESVAAAISTAVRLPVSARGGVFPASGRAEALTTGARAAVADLVCGVPDGVVLGPSTTTTTWRLARSRSTARSRPSVPCEPSAARRREEEGRTGGRRTAMRATASAPALLALVALVLAGCGGGGGSGTSAESSGGGPSAATDATLGTGVSDLGTVVVDADGRTVYVFDRDRPGSGESVCTGDCLEQWPPVVSGDEEPTADGVDGDLGTIERDDGTRQVTLGGAPLYLFAGDGGPGDVIGQAVGDVWWVVGPDGRKIQKAPAVGPDFSY